MQIEKYSPIVNLFFSVFLEAVLHCGRDDVGVCEDVAEFLLLVGEGRTVFHSVIFS